MKGRAKGGMKFFFKIHKGDLISYILQEIGHAGLEMEIHGINPSDQGKKDENPLKVMDRRIIDFQFFVFDSQIENHPSPYESHQAGEGPPNPSKVGDSMNRSNQGKKEEPCVPQNKRVET
jgi:hypothetical protein